LLQYRSVELPDGVGAKGPRFRMSRTAKAQGEGGDKNHTPALGATTWLTPYRGERGGGENLESGVANLTTNPHLGFVREVHSLLAKKKQ